MYNFLRKFIVLNNKNMFHVMCFAIFHYKVTLLLSLTVLCDFMIWSKFQSTVKIILF